MSAWSMIKRTTCQRGQWLVDEMFVPIIFFFFQKYINWLRRVFFTNYILKGSEILWHCPYKMCTMKPMQKIQIIILLFWIFLIDEYCLISKWQNFNRALRISLFFDFKSCFRFLNVTANIAKRPLQFGKLIAGGTF